MTIPTSAHQVIRLVNPHIRACMDVDRDRTPENLRKVEETFTVLESAIQAILDESAQLRFALEGKIMSKEQQTVTAS